jgi:TPR repeat protein
LSRAFPLAEGGDARAQAFLGFIYERGRGVPQDYVAAVHWYTCAAEQGHATAQYLLGLMYDKGHGVQRSDILALKWLNLAAAHAPPRAKEYYTRIRDAIAAKLTAAQADEAQWLASNFVPKAPR